MIPVISIIVPVYNVEKYLSQCIDSILAQAFIDFELLLVDDGSTDGSGRICDEYANKDARIQVFHKKNGGVSSARNIGLEHVQGEWITFVDSDDWLDLKYCQILWEEVQDVDLLFFSVSLHYKDGGKQIRYLGGKYCDDYDSIQEEILLLKSNQQKFEFFGYTWNKVFKASIIYEHKIRFLVNLSYREDEVFTTEYCRYIHSLKVLPVSLYNYRVLSTGLTARKKSSYELLLLAQSISESIPYFNNLSLIIYEYNRFLSFGLRAICLSDKKREKIKLIGYFNSYYKQCIKCRFPVRKLFQVLFGYPKWISVFLVFLYEKYLVFQTRI
ncbi:glycosyltransferase [uncultured Phocaeicola sp.]|uniref:glycosyltransferase family 2 protein n=1 Tax=uncultured Phocaeicola sp. TaxID=990718 RepID=UPI0014347477|nr:glycosyltransferase [uncultured Phocaeicola sp.]GFH99674.1 putative glycosyltransferase EpsJ [Bacteroidaceae bacterium]